MKAPLFVLAASLSAPLFAASGPGALPLPTVITSATRSPADPLFIGSAVDFVSAADLERRQISTLAGALGSLAGAPLAQSGVGGATTSLFLRGSNSNQTLFLVDGIRLNEPNTDYNVFLGGACISACDSLELSHGPQSTLYGGEAVGGVVALRAQRGSGPAGGRVALEAGSFGTVQGAVSAQGETGGTAYNLALQGGRTENERPNNSFDSENATLRVDRRITGRSTAGGTLRWFHGVYGDPGSRFTNDPDNETRESNLLATVFYDLAPRGGWAAHVIVGGQDRRFVAESPRAGGPTQLTVVTNRRGVVDAQVAYGSADRNRITGGVTAELNHTRNTGFGNINRRQSLVAAFLQEEIALGRALNLTAGVRSDDFDTFGRATTGRGTLAYRVGAPASPVKLRASYGTGFRSPSFLDLYGQSAFYVGNPALRPERVRGWDAGVDVHLAAGRGVVSATWFENRFGDLIASDFSASPSTVTNVQRARTRGAEFSARLAPAADWLATVSYTWLEARNLTTGARLLRRPSHSFSIDLWHRITGSVEAGIGLAGASGREDIHARTFATIDAEDYAVARVYASWAIRPNLSLKARVENALDESYESIHGYPAAGRAAFIGAERRW